MTPRGGNTGHWRRDEDGHLEKVPGRHLFKEDVPDFPGASIEIRLDATSGMFYAVVKDVVLQDENLPRLREAARGYMMGLLGLEWSPSIVLSILAPQERPPRPDLPVKKACGASVGFQAECLEIALEPETGTLRRERWWRARPLGSTGPGHRWMHPEHGWTGTAQRVHTHAWEARCAVLPYDERTWATLTALTDRLKEAQASLLSLMDLPRADLVAILQTGPRLLTLTPTPEAPRA